MSTATRELRAPAGVSPTGESLGASARAYFASDGRRVVQTALGLIWLLDGALQFQSFMYSKGFIQMLTGMSAGQPSWLASSVNWAAHQAQGNLSLFNTLFALVQVAIGVGILYRRTLRYALALSFVWAFIVWWFGEAFGMLFMTMASPLTGAPGAVLLYAIIGLIVWPNARPGGLLGVRGARVAWGAIWVLMAWLWLEAPSSNPNAIHDAINAAPSGMSWLSTVQDWAANATQGNGVAFSVVLALLSLAVGVSVVMNRRAREFLALGAALNLLFWVLGQGFGGIFQGGATDPNTGLLFIVFAYAMYTLVPYEQPQAAPERADPPAQEVALAS
jgi:hypothetical protein